MHVLIMKMFVFAHPYRHIVVPRPFDGRYSLDEGADPGFFKRGRVGGGVILASGCMSFFIKKKGKIWPKIGQNPRQRGPELVRS